MSIVVFGSINMDLTAYVPVLPRPGETLFGSRFLLSPGGKGANQAVAAAKLGATTRLVGRVGQDAFGREAVAHIQQMGVDIASVEEDPRTSTGLAVISVDEQGENAITVISGANMQLGLRDVVRCSSALNAQGRILLLQMEVPLQANLDAARAGHDQGALVMFDPAPAATLPPELYAEIDIITPNEGETGILTGIQPDTEDNAAHAAAELRSRGVKMVILKLGARGVYFDYDGGRGLAPAFSVTVVDTVAAGDAFNGGLAAALDDGKDFGEALRWGMAAGALACTKPGAMASMPTRAELELLLQKATA